MASFLGNKNKQIKYYTLNYQLKTRLEKNNNNSFSKCALSDLNLPLNAVLFYKNVFMYGRQILYSQIGFTVF